MRAEAGAGRLLPWMPVAFGTEIALYFTADREPVLAGRRSHGHWALHGRVFAAAAKDISGRRDDRRHRGGFCHRAGRPRASPMACWRGRCIRSRSRVLSRPAKIASAPTALCCASCRWKARVADHAGARSAVGSQGHRARCRQFRRIESRLLPPLAPLRPGATISAATCIFKASARPGSSLGGIKTVDPPVSGGLSLRYAAFMQGLRDAIDTRIRTVLEGDKRAIATALLTGRRDAISSPVNDAMFISGLGHVLSISGYHMAVVAGVVFFAVRALLALIPGLTVSFPIKKWSAAAALAAAAFYLLLSGAEVATQRSFFMTAVVLIAIMVDRRAVTFRTLAVAAMIVLAIAPEALVHPSFQMSFAATLGLVALVQIGMPRLLASPDNSATARAALWAAAKSRCWCWPRWWRGCHHALCRLSFPSGDALWRARQSGGDAGGLGGGDAGGPARPRRDAVRLRRRVLADHGLGIDWMIAVTQWVAACPARSAGWRRSASGR